MIRGFPLALMVSGYDHTMTFEDPWRLPRTSMAVRAMSIIFVAFVSLADNLTMAQQFHMLIPGKNRSDAHRELKRPWNGVSAFFDYSCNDIDAHIVNSCSIMGIESKQSVIL